MGRIGWRLIWREAVSDAGLRGTSQICAGFDTQIPDAEGERGSVRIHMPVTVWPLSVRRSIRHFECRYPMMC